MAMKSNDLKQKRDDIRQKIADAIKNEDASAYDAAFGEMVECIGQEVRDEMTQQMEGLRQDMDSRILESRGVRQMTSAERDYFTQVLDAMKSRNPEQALSNLSVIMPETVINSVFEDLRTQHPLLSKINFVNTGAAIKLLMNAGAPGAAAWGELCANIVQEASAGFKAVTTNLCKLSAFILVCKEALELGPEWLDRYVREVLYEYIANGLEKAIITGTGNNEPIGMDRDVSDDATVVGGVYPQKDPISVSVFDMQTVGNLMGILSMNPNGGMRDVYDVILIVNSANYYNKIMPAISVLAPDGTYRTVIPYIKPENIIRSAYVTLGEAIIGIPRRYFMAIGSPKDGRIEYSDEAKFIEDKRAYIVKLYGNGMPKDDNAFLRLDISGLVPVQFEFVSVDARTKDDTATLNMLQFSGITLSPAFDPDEDTYTATTTAASTIVTAIPTHAGATIALKLGTTAFENGASITLAAGANVVTAVVTAEDGTTTETYTATITKS